MFNVRLARALLYRKWLFTWLSLVVSLMVSYFVLFFSHEMSWVRSGTELSQFLRLFLSTSVDGVKILILCILSDDALYFNKFHENISKGFRVTALNRRVYARVVAIYKGE